MSADTTAPSMHEEEEEEEDDEEEDVSEEDSLRKRARCMFLQMIMPDKLQGGGRGESGAFTKNTPPPRVWMVDAIDKPKTMEENASRPTKLVKMKLVIMPATCRTPFEGQVLATFLKEAVEKEAW